MKLTKEQLRKLNLFSYDPLFLEKSEDVLKDFIYSSLACSFIYLSEYEVEVLLNYYANSVSKKKATKLIDRDVNKEKLFNDFDSYLFYAKSLKDVYKFSDGIFIDEHTYKQKKLYLLNHRYQEVLDINVFNDLSFLKSELENRNILYICFNNATSKKMPFKNVKRLEIDKEEIKSYASYQEWLDIIKMRVMILNFDIAFIDLGLYSNLLNHFIVQSLNKIAITMKGAIYEK